jgi:hypothetical protein
LVKTVVHWVLALLLVIGAAVGIEAEIGVGTKTPARSASVSALDHTLWTISQQVAVSSGDPGAYDRQAVGPLPIGRAALLTTGDGPVRSTEPAYVVELRGSFGCDACLIPPEIPPAPGARGATGHVTMLYDDAATFESAGYLLGNVWYDLGRLGKPFPLVAPPSGLTAAACTACSSPSATAVARHVATPSYALLSDGWQPGQQELLALIEGPFHAVRTAGGVCAWLGSKGAFLWPAGYRVRFDPTELIAPNGTVVAHEGELVSVAGGVLTRKSSSRCWQTSTQVWYLNGAVEASRQTG